GNFFACAAELLSRLLRLVAPVLPPHPKGGDGDHRRWLRGRSPRRQRTWGDGRRPARSTPPPAPLVTLPIFDGGAELPREQHPRLGGDLGEHRRGGDGGVAGAVDDAAELVDARTLRRRPFLDRLL